LVQSPLAGEISFRPLEAADFSTLAAWLAKPHVREFYQKRAVTLNEIAQEYGPSVRREEAGMSNLGLLYGAPFAYLQCYRNADYPEWMELIGVTGGISVDFYIGEQSCLHKGYGRAVLALYLQQVAFVQFRKETRAYIAHDLRNTAALRCSQAAGFSAVHRFLEDGCDMLLLAADRS
jgi:aminoglycoside 6'-N-acetyltransferase